jgi:hypothetical protein
MPSASTRQISPAPGDEVVSLLAEPERSEAGGLANWLVAHGGPDIRQPDVDLGPLQRRLKAQAGAREG